MPVTPEKPKKSYYEIQVSSQINPDRSEWLGNLSLSLSVAPDGSTITVLSGPVIDQAALFGIINRIRDLGLRLISVNVIDQAPANASSSDLEQEETR
jgi:hypothetical protein